jgi:uncharacterized protein YbbC (DUF1343 family)
VRYDDAFVNRRHALMLLAGGAVAGGALAASPASLAAPGLATRESRIVRTAPGPVASGADVVARDNFELFRGKRIGLIANHTSRVGSEHLADRMARAGEIRLTRILAPEHGFRGGIEAGKKVESEVDAATGIQVASLYGATRQPTRAMLAGLDVLVFDMQDIGARFYTYISTMGLAMQAARDAGLPFVVLDRPNPLGGEDMSGFVLEPAHRSFVGQFPIPLVHGLTVGELARAIVGRRLLEGVAGLQLEVVACRGLQRAMRWPETARVWHPTSPNIPSFAAALTYPGVSLLSATVANDGVGTDEPFLLAGARFARGERLAAALTMRALPGVRFDPAVFTPRVIPGKATQPKQLGHRLEGVRIHVTDHRAYKPLETGLHLFDAFAREAKSTGRRRFVDRATWLTRLAGTERLGAMLADGNAPDAIARAWTDEVARFRQAVEPYRLYS